MFLKGWDADLSLVKRSICTLLCLLLVSVMFPIKVAAIKIDGKIENLEWNNATKTEIFPYPAKTNCDINFASMNVLVDEKSKVVFLAFYVIQGTTGALNNPNISSGVRLDMGGGKEIICRYDGTNSFDRSTYSVEQKMAITNIDYLWIEMKIGYLFGVPAPPFAGLQLIDSFGKYSNYCKYPVNETTTATPKPTTTKPITTQKPATTKPTTTKPNPTQKPVLYKVKFDSNGGKGGKTQSLPYGAKPIPPEVNREGYIFSGWSPQVVAVTGATTYKAQWVKDKPPTTSPPATQTTTGRTPGVTQGTSTTLNNPVYTLANTSPVDGNSGNEVVANDNAGKPDDISQGEVTPQYATNQNGENEPALYDEATSGLQNNSGESNGASASEIFPKYDFNEKNSNNTKKQIIAVVVAVILLLLAGYFFLLALKQNKPPKADPESAIHETHESESEDDF